MANILYPPPRPQSVGEVLDAAFRIYSATLLKCLPYSFTAVIVGQALSVYDVMHRHGLTPDAMRAAQLQRVTDPLWWAVLLAAFVLGTMFANAVFLRQYAIATGHATSWRAELGRALRRVPGVLLMALLMVLAFAVTAIPVGIVLGVIGAATGFAGGGTRAPGTQVWLVVGFVLVVLLGASWVVIKWVCGAATYLLTDRGPIASLSHSWQLTAGNFWRLSAIYAVGWILLLVFYALASIVGGVVALLLARGDVVVVLAVTSAVVALLAALFTPFYHALVLAVFGDLSARREGADLAQRISAAAVP